MKFKLTTEIIILFIYILVYVAFTSISKIAKFNLNPTTEFTILMLYALFGVFLLFIVAWLRRKKEKK